MAIFHCYVSSPEGIYNIYVDIENIGEISWDYGGIFLRNIGGIGLGIL